MDSRLQRLFDEHEVQRLVLTWMDGVDSRDPAKICSVWADFQETEFTGFPDMGTGPIVPGRHKVAERAPLLCKMLSCFDATQHVNTNHLVTINGNSAACSSYVLATHYMAVDSGEPSSTIGARYDVEAYRGSEGWRLTKLKWTKLWISGNDALWLEVGRRMRLPI